MTIVCDLISATKKKIINTIHIIGVYPEVEPVIFTTGENDKNYAPS
jgi:hypothetical protein